MKRAAIYIRVSTTAQAEEGSSLESQQEMASKYCSLNNLTICEVISDSGLSGRKGKRPGFDRVMELARTKQIDAVVVYSLSRLGRNVKQMAECMEVFKKNNIEFHSQKERIDTGSAIGELFFNMINAFNQFESDQTGERIRDTKHSNKVAKRTYSSPIYGYQNDLNTHQLIPIPEELAVVDRIKEMRLTKVSYGKIAKLLNESGSVTKKAGAMFHASTVRNIHLNPIYK